MPVLPVKKKEIIYFMSLHNFIYNFKTCLVFIYIKQTFYYNRVYSALLPYICSHFFARKSFAVVVIDIFFSFERQVVAGLVRQVAVLCSNDYMGI